ncbi:hypothetical protein [Actinophytocola gossypii]|uniref:Uncharacterized protein n=1 Tax=Actinophytocola gossypii TaxID=2812003 RepID=A0ABT2JC60_9PSEU|nr:hypothetical protein [Actinophytocola gossypii]MCT2585452.1 hypothetical protein [Actinophytocola gossypii]
MAAGREAAAGVAAGVAAGAAAGVVAWLGMAGWALLGVTTLGLGAAATPAAVALAVGGSVGVTEDLGPATLSGSVHVLPLGVSLVGAVLLAAVLTTWPRLAGASAVVVAGLVALPFLPAGDLDVLPWSTQLGGLAWLVVVVGTRVAMWWFPWVRRVVTVFLGAAALATLIGVVASVAGGARVLGTMVLAAPNLLCVALTRGLGVPWETRGPDLPLPTIDTGGLGPLAVPVWPLTAVAVVVLVLVAVFAGRHAPWVAAVCLAGMVVVGGAAVRLSAGFFAVELGVAGNALAAAAAGLGGGLVAWLLVQGVRYWHRRHA